MIVGACAAPPDDRPWRGGGGPGGTGTTGGGADARGDATLVDGAPATLHGVVCIATDLRAPIACTMSPGAGLPVTDLVGGATTTTASDSSFALDTGGAPLAEIDVETGGMAAIVPSVAIVVPSATAIVVPVVDATYLENLEADLSAIVPDGSGIVALYVTDASGAGAPGWSATPPPGVTAGPYYDDTTTVGWSSGGTTGAIGGVLIFGVPAGTISIGIAKGATSATVDGVRVIGGHVTFARAIVSS